MLLHAPRFSSYLRHTSYSNMHSSRFDILSCTVKYCPQRNIRSQVCSGKGHFGENHSTIQYPTYCLLVWCAAVLRLRSLIHAQYCTQRTPRGVSKFDLLGLQTHWPLILTCLVVRNQVSVKSQALGLPGKSSVKKVVRRENQKCCNSGTNAPILMKFCMQT